MSSEERITNLEVKLSFAEDLIENLNQTIYKQQQQIEFLYREMSSLKEQMRASGSEGLSGGNDARDLRDEIPPHY
jgi:SlyX protein